MKPTSVTQIAPDSAFCRRTNENGNSTTKIYSRFLVEWQGSPFLSCRMVVPSRSLSPSLKSIDLSIPTGNIWSSLQSIDAEGSSGSFFGRGPAMFHRELLLLTASMLLFRATLVWKNRWIQTKNGSLFWCRFIDLTEIHHLCPHFPRVHWDVLDISSLGPMEPSPRSTHSRLPLFATWLELPGRGPAEGLSVASVQTWCLDIAVTHMVHERRPTVASLPATRTPCGVFSVLMLLLGAPRCSSAKECAPSPGLQTERNSRAPTPQASPEISPSTSLCNVLLCGA